VRSSLNLEQTAATVIARKPLVQSPRHGKMVNPFKEYPADFKRQKLLRKHGLGKNLAHTSMPYLWASVEKPTPPKRLCHAQNELSELIAKTIHLTAEGRFPSRGILAAIVIFSFLCQMDDQQSSSIVMWHDISMWPSSR
jgi:hypothetical protein